MAIPSTMRAWQFKSTKGGLDKNMFINAAAPVPTPKPNQHLVRVLSTALNPVDFKVSEAPFIGQFTIPKNASPGIDFVGELVKPASGSSLKSGQMVFGMAGAALAAGGAMGEYAVADIKATAVLPAGANAVDACTIPVAGLTSYQAIAPYVKAGSRVFINGGSGGTGVFAIQIAKQLGCHVTTSCSTRNVDLCKSLGADDVIDYTQGSVLEQLKQRKPFDHVVDNVGHDFDLYWRAHDYSVPTAKWVFVGMAPNPSCFAFLFKVRLIPGFLGGGKRKLVQIFAMPEGDQLSILAGWMKEGKVKAVIDQRFSFEEGKEAMTRMKSGRARGKVVIEVNAEVGKA
jgi:NADPH:quinone reductase-like Zn-dependent oxidoreductase